MLSTNHAARRLQRFCLTVELVPEALDVIEAICNDDVVARESPLDGRVFLCTGILLGLGGVIYTSGDA